MDGRRKGGRETGSTGGRDGWLSGLMDERRWVDGWMDRRREVEREGGGRE